MKVKHCIGIAVGMFVALTGWAGEVESSAPGPQAAPALELSFNCGECAPSEAVKDAIQQGYAEAMAKAGRAPNPQAKVTLNVVEYAERSSGARILFGVFAGKDKIRGTVMANGTEFEVEDTAVTTFNGIETVARNIGEAVFAKVTGVN